MTNIGYFHFADPGWLWLASAGPALLAWLFIHAARGRREQLARMASPHFVAELTASHSPARRHFKNGLAIVAVILAALALARPQWGTVDASNTRLSEDVVFVLDTSLSMTTTDVLPSRMQRAKYSIMDFVQQQSHGRVGLVAFAGSAFTQCPLTFDTDAFEETLEAVDEKTIPVPGTDIGRGLEEAYHAMDKGSRRKLIILATDGEDLETSGIATAKRLATNGVVIFTIGVGTPDGKEIQMTDAAGHPEWVRDAKGEIVRSHLDESTLKQIAEVTGGSYFPLGPMGQGLARVRPAIHALELREDQKQMARNGVERFYLPLALMLALLVIESLTGTRRAEPHPESAIPQAPVKAMLVLLALMLALNVRADSVTNAPEPVTARDYYNAGTKLLTANKYADAERMFDSGLALQDERTQPPSLYNLGHVRFAQGVQNLTNGPSAKNALAQGEQALAHGNQAMTDVQGALGQPDLERVVDAYLEGRGARRELREAEKVVKEAMDKYGATLTKWQRASDDFKSAAEMNPADTNAVQNAKKTDEAIAKLVDALQRMQQMMGSLGGQRQQLGQMLSKLKGQTPGFQAPPGASGEDDEDDISPGSLTGQTENPTRTGGETEMPISPDQAEQILNGLQVDSNKGLPMGGDKEGVPAGAKKGRIW